MRFNAAVGLALVHVLIVAFAVLLFDLHAFGRDLDGRYAQAPLSDWYKAQRNQRGDVCCDRADGFTANDWGRGPAGYWAEVDGKRFQIPPWALSNGSHPRGVAVVWLWFGEVRCFTPGAEG